MMKSRMPRFTSPGALAVGLVLVLATVTPALAGSPNDVPAKPGDSQQGNPELSAPKYFGSPMVIPAAAFINDGFGPGSYFFSFDGRLYAEGGTSSCLYAPVHLPYDAEVYWFCATLYDNSASDISVQLRRCYGSTGASEIMATVTSSVQQTTPTAPCTSTITSPIVSTSYEYYLTVCLFDTTEGIYGVRVYYYE